MRVYRISIPMISMVVMVALLFSTGCSSGGVSDIPGGLDTPVAKIDGGFITAKELLEHPRAQDIVDELIYEKLILKKARELNLEVSDEEVLATIENYAARQDGRRAFIEEQWESGLTLNRLIVLGRITMLEGMIIEQKIEDPSRDEVVEFLEGQFGEMLINAKASDLGISPDDVTVEDVYDDASKQLRELKLKKALESRAVVEDVLRSGHEVVNLLRLTAKDDPEGETWAAADAGSSTENPDAEADNEGDEKKQGGNSEINGKEGA